MKAKLGWIEIEESGAFGDGDKFIVQFTNEFDRADPWFYTSVDGLKVFCQELQALIDEALAPYATPPLDTAASGDVALRHARRG